MNLKKIATVLSVITALIILTGSHIAYHRTFADAQTVQKLEQRLDRKILEDQAHNLRARVWTIQDHWRGKNMPQTDMDAIRRLHDEREQILRKIELLNIGKKTQ